MEKKPLENYLGELLLKRHLSLAVAESCTGGLVGHLITNVSGSSQYFLGGVMVYSDDVKMKLLGVRQLTLEKHGAVSRETVLEMASGVRRALAADIGAAVSGIAGPGGGTPEKPVGLTWIGLSAPGLEAAWSFTWPGDRLAVKEQSAEQVLRLLVDYLMGSLPDQQSAGSD